ncbi:PTPN23 [Bugula neritina]|uniref:PTPN23 n=1 Tax=Bugula neritina TaxID=10212 RepID=A0A7J7ISR5_BUGNE|nr:PTPN23 [Bugula neritina]
MEAARFPMLSLKPKSVTTKTKFKDVLLPLIVAHFDEEASKYTAECSELDDLRLSACNAPLDYNGCATLKKYYCQLCFLLRRFPFLVGHQDLDLKFSWKDAYSGKTVCLNDIEFEKAVILYNTAAIHSFLGSVETRNSAEGMKVSCTHFQNAAWAFQTVRDEFSSDYFSDWTFDILSFLQQLMLVS